MYVFNQNEVWFLIFHLINDFIIKIFTLEQPHTIYQETNHLEIWEEFPTSSLGGKCQNLSLCRNSTSIQHFFLRVYGNDDACAKTAAGWHCMSIGVGTWTDRRCQIQYPPLHFVGGQPIHMVSRILCKSKKTDIGFVSTANIVRSECTIHHWHFDTHIFHMPFAALCLHTNWEHEPNVAKLHTLVI